MLLPFTFFLLSLGVSALLVAGELLIVNQLSDLFYVNAAALDCNFAGAFDGHLAYVALWRRFFLLFNCRLDLWCVAIEHLDGIKQYNSTLLAKESCADGMDTNRRQTWLLILLLLLYRRSGVRLCRYLSDFLLCRRS